MDEMTAPWSHVWTQLEHKPEPSVRPVEVATAVVFVLLAAVVRWAPSRTTTGRVPQEPAISSPKWAPDVRRPTLRQTLGAVLAGCAVGLFVGGSGGALVGLASTIGVLVFGSRRVSESETRSRLRLVAAAPPVVDLFAAGLAAGLLPADAAAVTATAFIGRLNGTTLKHDGLNQLDKAHPLTRRDRFALIRSQRFAAASERGSLDRLDAEHPLLRGGYLTPIRSRLFGTTRERGSLDRINAAHPLPRHDRLARIRSRLVGAAPECRGLDQVNAAHPVQRRDRLAFFRSHRFGAKPTPTPAVEPTAEIARRFAAAAQALRRGADPETAWSLLAVDSVTAPVAAAALRASRTGAPAAETVSKAARDLWRAADQAMQTRVRSVAVRATVPLALCFLPAFILIGVMPTALGLLAALRP